MRENMIEHIERLFELVFVPLCHVAATSQRMPLNSQYIFRPLGNSSRNVFAMHLFWQSIRIHVIVI